MPKVFAEQYDREKMGEMDLILFPRDIEWRRTLFPQGVFEHPAKMNMYMCQELIRYLTKPGDTILDATRYSPCKNTQVDYPFVSTSPSDNNVLVRDPYIKPINDVLADGGDDLLDVSLAALLH